VIMVALVKVVSLVRVQVALTYWFPVGVEQGLQKPLLRNVVPREQGFAARADGATEASSRATTKCFILCLRCVAR